MSELFSKAVEILRFWIGKHPDAPLEVVEEPGMLMLRPTLPDTFSVEITDEGEELILSTEYWHTHLDDSVAAASLSFWLMTPYSRIVRETKGDIPWASWIEDYTTDQWEPTDEVFFLDPREDSSWVPTNGEVYTRVTQQQSVLKWRKPIQTIRPGIVLDHDELPIPSHLGTLIETSPITRLEKPSVLSQSTVELQ